MKIRKVICLNCGERYGEMIDHHSYKHNLSSRVYYELTM